MSVTCSYVLLVSISPITHSKTEDWLVIIWQRKKENVVEQRLIFVLLMYEK